MYYRFFSRLNSNSACHYTSVDALRKIILSEEFWLTRWNELNDTDELRYGKEYSLDVLIELGFDEHYIRNQVYSQDPDLFVLSLTFNEYGDKVGHWMMYGKYGEGICIKLNVKNLVEQLSIQQNTKIVNPEILIGDVNYSKEEYSNKLLQIWNDLSYKNKLKQKELRTQFFAHTLCSLPFVKHPEFHIEKELRIIITDKIGNKLNNGDKRSIPFSTELIEEIIIGPKICNENSEQFKFEDLRNEFNYIIGRDIVKISTAPLR